MKKILLILILGMFLLTACSQPTTEPDTNEQAPTESKPEEDIIRIVAFGDSLTEGLGVERENAYPAILEDRLMKKGYNVKVFNSGLSGETTTGAAGRVDWVLSLKPDIVIFEIGANDGFRGIDLDVTRTNIDTTVKELKESGAIVVLAGMQMAQNLGETYVREFEAMYPIIAEENDVIFIENFLAGVIGNETLNQADQIHPNFFGYEIIVDQNVLPVVENILQN